VLFATMMLFAQQRFQGGGGGADGTVRLIGSCVQLSFGMVGLALLIWFMVTAYGALNAISPRNREMEPGMIFLLLIPCFNLVWFFLVVIRLANSFEKEFSDRGIRSDGDFGKSQGITMIILVILCGPIGWIFQIMYILKIQGYAAQLAEGGGRRRRRDRDEDDEDVDDDDDRPSRRRRRRDDDDD
jgi:hypothetical protein